jgi:Zn-dependent protease/CBS domain-containing protein
MPGFKSVRIGAIDGIVIRLDWSVLLISALFVWSLAASGLPEMASGYSAAAYWIAAAVTTFAFFTSLLAHELSHCFVARHQGLPVRDVTLWLLGGVSTIEREPQTPTGDLRIAVAGPAMSFGIGVVVLGIAGISAATGMSELLTACALWLGSVNLVLAVFNLVPAAPLDGGRVLRAIRWRQTHDRSRAAIDAARAGRVFAFALIGLGLVEFLFGITVSGLWFLLLGWFVLNAAQAEETQVHLTQDLASTRVHDVMTADPITVRDNLSVDEVLHDYVLARHCSTFPVVDDAGRLAGLATLGRLRAVPAGRRADTRIADIAWPVDDLTISSPDELILDVLRRETPGGDGRILVCSGTTVAGIVSPSDIARAIRLADLERTLSEASRH